MNVFIVYDTIRSAGKNSKKSETRRKEESMSISGSCSEGLDNVSAHEKQRYTCYIKKFILPFKTLNTWHLVNSLPSCIHICTYCTSRCTKMSKYQNLGHSSVSKVIHYILIPFTTCRWIRWCRYEAACRN